MDETTEAFVGIVLGLAIIAAAVVIGVGLKYATCNARAQAMGMQSSFGLLKGCMVQDEKGKWWPLNSVRKFGD